jgi:hypothetical protein
MAQGWADDTARRSDLGDRDALLAVATGDRAYAYSFDADYPLSDDQLDEVAAKDIEPALARNDWAGAVVAAANGYRAELNKSHGGGVLIAIVVVVVLAAAGGWLWWRRQRRRRRPAPPPGGVSTDELATRANALLVELDDELRSSERELSLASGQYGPEATASFTAALESARQEVAEAFRLRMTLDEPSTKDDTAKRRVLTEIIDRCEKADQRLDAEAEAFDALRELETHVEQSVAALGERRTAAQGRLPGAETTLAELQGKYTGDALAGVSGNVTQARERLDFAATALTRASEAVAQGQRPAAALAVRAAEEALGQADTLLGAIDRVSADLTAARCTVDSLLSEVQSEAAQTKLAGAEQTVAAVRALLSQPKLDPLWAVRQLQEADRALDQARDAAQRAARARTMLDQALPIGRAEVAAAGDFIATRRAAVTSQARTWLAEAQRRLARAEALAATDPVSALDEAQQATRLAGQASQSARLEVESWSPPGGGFAGGGDAGFAGALLGGILASGVGHHYGHSGYGGSRTRTRRSGGGGGARRHGGGGRF